MIKKFFILITIGIVPSFIGNDEVIINIDKTKYPKIKAEDLVKATEEYLENSKEKYIKSWCAVKYENDSNLYIDAHY